MWYIYTVEYYSARQGMDLSQLKWDEWTRAYTGWSKSEREKQMPYINTYMWNIEKWYGWTYLLGRNRDADEQDINRSMLPVHTHTHTHTPSASTSCPSFTTCVTSCTHPHLVLQFSVRFHVSLLPTLHKDSLAALPNAHSLTPLHKNLSCFLKWHGISTVENMFILKFYSM